MLDRLVYYFLMICIFGGFLIVIGSAGASDLEMIGLTDLIIRGSIGAVLIIIGVVGLKKGGYDVC